MKARQGKSEGGDHEAQSARDRWMNAPVDWGRVFKGEPFRCPEPTGDTQEALEKDAKAIYTRYKKPLWYPMRAEGPYVSNPPEEIDQDTGEITPRSYWEMRTSKDGTRMWWPKLAHVRAEMSEFRKSAERVEQENARAAVERAIDARAGKD